MGIQAKRVSGVVKFSRETMLTCEAEAGRARKSERLKTETKRTKITALEFGRAEPFYFIRQFLKKLLYCFARHNYQTLFETVILLFARHFLNQSCGVIEFRLIK